MDSITLFLPSGRVRYVRNLFRLADLLGEPDERPQSITRKQEEREGFTLYERQRRDRRHTQLLNGVKRHGGPILSLPHKL